MRYYKDYFSIDEAYAPCMNITEINRSVETWLQFYPHKTFVDVLRNLLLSLDGGDKSIWLYGAYGTGKSHAALVLEKLFMDDESRVLKWLEKRKDLIPNAVRSNLLAQRRNGVLAVFESNSDNVATPEQFLMRMENAIIRALKKGGYSIPPFGSMDRIISRIEDEEASFFRKRDELQFQLQNLTPEITTVEKLKAELNNPDLQSGLISDIMIVMHARDIYINLTSRNLIEWVNQVLQQNNLTKMVFIWDEFSTYFEQNRGQLKTFEEVAEAAQSGKFYFVPVTHMELQSLLANGTESSRKASDRFSFIKLDMPMNTALLLAADAFKVKDDSWLLDREALWADANGVVSSYIAVQDEECRSNPESFKGVLPIHPMTAFALKHLSLFVGSNQRSMFNFLKGEVTKSEFQKFIECSGPESPERRLLTADYLWNYFVERDDLGRGENVQEIKLAFETRKKNLDDQEKRVFRAVLIYWLLSQCSAAASELLKPSIENLVRIFQGDGEITNVREILKNLQNKHCFSIINNVCEIYYSQANSSDLSKKIEDIKKQFDTHVVNKAEEKLDSKIKSFKDKLRLVIRAGSVDKAQNSCSSNKELFGEKDNKILLQFIIAKDHEEQLKVEEKAKFLADAFKDFRMIFVTMPEWHFCVFNANYWDEYVEQLAHLAIANDDNSRNIYNSQIANMDRQWQPRLIEATQKLRVYKPNANGEPFVEDLTFLTFEEYIKRYIKECFSGFVDDLSNYSLNSMNRGSKFYKQFAIGGMDFSAAIGAAQSGVKSLKDNRISDTPQWFTENPDHPLTKIRDYCNVRLKNALSDNGSCSIKKIYNALQRPPYGLISTPFSAMVLGFVLKEWASESRQLQWSDGINSKPLNKETLAEIIEQVIKTEGPINREKLICKVSKEEKKFIDLAPVMFGFARVPNSTVESTLSAIGARLEHIANKVPLWTLPGYIEEKADPQADKIKCIIDDLCQAQSVSSRGVTQARSEKVKAIGKMLMETEGLADVFAKYINPDSFAAAFVMYVDKIKPELAAIAEQTRDLSRNYCSILKNRFATTSSWLWNADNVDKELNLVYAQYKIIQVVQALINSKAFINYEDAIARFNQAIFVDNKLSNELLNGNYPFLNEFVRLLENTNVGNGFSDLADKFVQHQSVLKELFFDQAKTILLKIFKEQFSSQLSPLGAEEIKEVYDTLSCGAKRHLDEFNQIANREIDEYLKQSTVRQMLSLWQRKTQSNSPKEWSQIHNMPASVLLGKNDRGLIGALNDPGRYQQEMLRNAKTKLESLELIPQELWEGNFLKLVLPKKYQQLNIDVPQLCRFLKDKLSIYPNLWLNENNKLNETVENFIREHYLNSYKNNAVNKVKAMSEAEAKQLLLKFVENNPDVGLKILE